MENVMRKMLNKIVPIIIVLIIVISSTGCRTNRRIFKDFAVKYISDKYPDDMFETLEDYDCRLYPEKADLIKRLNTASYNSGSIAMKSQHYYQREFYVVKNNDGSYGDNYLMLKYEEQTIELRN